MIGEPTPDGPESAAVPASGRPRELVLITGISGSGKSVALHALEDTGFFCVDNLPPELLRDYMRLDHPRYTERVAIAVDARAARSLPALVPLIFELRSEGVTIRPLFLDASTDTLVRRFSETRRPHPLSQPDSAGGLHHALIEAIELERLLLAELREVSTVIDTSTLRPAGLRQQVRNLVDARHDRLTLVFESFAFKYGVPLDADYVFDVRMLPNPYYVRELRPLSGRDAPVAEFLSEQPEAAEMLDQIESFLRRWLPALATDQRAYVTVAIGCTGGQHRSVYIVEQLRERFADHGATLARHRELDAID
ncbi:RNase adapter RapZ [Aquincola sp. S2]|uniref:RNase adapter RapZ n=1 Tax=Pseudaquabacterium terrae TaxID=2732868 RepID=A0ABX2EU46_9BURK|nr:RNase adapter RapZ [Aquabacterium terrae]NRF71949.1 RNase adapter RapZ [Aquabacterium terrae]